MKKGLSFSLCLLLALLALTGCSVSVSQKQPQIVKSYPEETAPSQVIKTENQWVMLHSTYGSTDYTISAGEEPDSTSTIYSVQDVSIWYFEANENGIVWCEKNAETYAYKVYVFETETVDTIFETAVDTGFQPKNIGIYLNTAYFCTIDYEQQKVLVLAYDLNTKTTAEIHTAAFQEEKQPYSMNLENEFLTIICSDQIKVLNLRSGDTVFDSTLPDTVQHVFCASYDWVNDTCALYYADGDSEDIGILLEGDTQIRSVFTFSRNLYAYMDKIECHDGQIYWIRQANVSGAVSEHYTMVCYNYLEGKAFETDRTFAFCRAGDDLYALRFNQHGDYTHIDLCRY